MKTNKILKFVLEAREWEIVNEKISFDGVFIFIYFRSIYTCTYSYHLKDLLANEIVN